MFCVIHAALFQMHLIHITMSVHGVKSFFILFFMHAYACSYESPSRQSRNATGFDFCSD